MSDRDVTFEITGPTREEWNAARELITTLKDKVAQLTGNLSDVAKFHDEFVEELSQYVSESYDGDGSAESQILQWAKDVDTLAGIVSRLTSPYR